VTTPDGGPVADPSPAGNRRQSAAAVNEVAHPTAKGVEYQRRAEAAFHMGRYDEAIRLASHALVEMPNHGRLLLFISQGLFAVGNYRAAAGAIHQAATVLSGDELGYVVKNYRNYYRGRDYVVQMDRLLAYAKEHPEAAYAHFLIGYQHGFLGHEVYARRELAKAAELEGRDRLAAELLKTFGGDRSRPSVAQSEKKAAAAVPADDATASHVPAETVSHSRDPGEPSPEEPGREDAAPSNPSDDTPAGN